MFYDVPRKKTVMLGGWQPGAGFYHPDQWEWDGAAQTWTERQLSGTVPSPRFGASVVWDSTRNRAVLFGGFDDTTGRKNDTWEWDSQNLKWEERTVAGTKPSPRHSALIAYDSARGKVVAQDFPVGPHHRPGGVTQGAELGDPLGFGRHAHALGPGAGEAKALRLTRLTPRLPASAATTATISSAPTTAAVASHGPISGTKPISTPIANVHSATIAASAARANRIAIPRASPAT